MGGECVVFVDAVGDVEEDVPDCEGVVAFWDGGVAGADAAVAFGVEEFEFAVEAAQSRIEAPGGGSGHGEGPVGREKAEGWINKGEALWWCEARRVWFFGAVRGLRGLRVACCVLKKAC